MNHSQTNLAQGARVSLAGLLLNVGLAAIKLMAGLIGQSFALVADAVESSLDVIGSLVVWRGLRIAGRPADSDHPYGHGRAESLAGMLVAIIMLVAGVGIAAEAIRGLLSPKDTPAPFTLAVILAVVAIKESMYQYARRVARRTGSGAVLIDAWHHRSDAITSAAAAIGLTIAIVGGPAYAQADNWAALVAGGVIVFNAYCLLRGPLRDLMDTRPREVVDRARVVAAGVPGVAGVEKILARKSGVSYLVDMHVEVAPEMTVDTAHGIAHAVKDAVRGAIPEVQDVLVHIEPFGARAR